MTHSRTRNKVTRRGFIKGSLSAAGLLWFPAIVPSSVLGADAPSERIRLGIIGTGGMGILNLKAFMELSGCQVVAVCDADKKHLDEARRTAKLQAESAFGDFREVLGRDDIDAVVVATPDHWHVPISLAAVKAGKDVYCEKPLSLTIHEGRVLSDAVRQYGRIFQVGSHQRSGADFRFACELVRNGRIGKLKQVIVEIPANNRPNPIGWKEQPVPAELNYEMWLGPAPRAPYVTQRCHYSFRFITDYSGGQMTNWGAHHLDIAQWGLGMDSSGPIKVSGKGDFPKDGLFNTADNVLIEYTYPEDVTMICKTGGSCIWFEGQEGRIYVSREELKTWPANLKTNSIRPNEIHLYNSLDHRVDFLDCIRSRQRPAADVEIGHRSATVCHLGTLAMQLGTELHWDPATERFTNHEAANRLLSRTVRKEWLI